MLAAVGFSDFFGTFGENSDSDDDFFVNFSFSTFGSTFGSSGLISSGCEINDFATLIGFRLNFGDIWDSFDNFDASFDFSFFSEVGLALDSLVDFGCSFGSSFDGVLNGTAVAVGINIGCGRMSLEEVGMAISSSDGTELVEVVLSGGGGG